VPSFTGHPASFPRQLQGSAYGDKCVPLENMHPVSKKWICVVSKTRVSGVEETFTAAKGSILRCLAFWWLGESRTLYQKSGDVCVCVPVLNILP
jgi:hypothetical protein